MILGVMAPVSWVLGLMSYSGKGTNISGDASFYTRSLPYTTNQLSYTAAVSNHHKPAAMKP